MGVGKSLAEMSSRASARFYLQSVVFPIIEGIAKREKITLNEEISKMISKGETIGTYAQLPEFRGRVDDILGSPAACFVLGKFQHHLRRPDQEIRASAPWWVERIGETRPEIYGIIKHQPGGEKWLGDTFIDIVKICREHAG
jgi:hypothetical protein